MSQNTITQELDFNPAGKHLLGRIVGFIDDRVNPILVKELRQAVRSRFIMVIINLMLVVELCVVAGFLLATTGTNYTLGRELFTTLHMLLVSGCILFVPAYVAVRFGAERSDVNVDLMYTTTLTPFSIVWGKFLSGLVVTLILFSTAAPFMVLTYMLRGIDVPTILLVVGYDFLLVTAAIQFAILVTSSAKSLFARGGIILLCLIAFGYGIASSAIVTTVMVYERGMLGSGGYFWVGVGYFVVGTLAYHILLMLCTAAIISPPASNRALKVRVFLFACWLVSGIVAGITGHFMGDMDVLVAWGLASASWLVLVMLISACERDYWGPRMLAAIPRNGIKRVLAFLFYSGSAGGFLLTLGMMAVSLSIPLFLQTGAMSFGDIYNGYSFYAYSIAYILTGVLVCRYIGPGPGKTQATGAIVLALVAIGCMAPVIIMYFLRETVWDTGYMWRIGNPFAGIASDSHDGHVFLLFSCTWATIMFALCVPWMFGQWRRFRRLEPAVITGPDAGEDSLSLALRQADFTDEPEDSAAASTPAADTTFDSDHKADR